MNFALRMMIIQEELESRRLSHRACWQYGKYRTVQFCAEMGFWDLGFWEMGAPMVVVTLCSRDRKCQNAREMKNWEGNSCYSTFNVYKLILIGYK